MRPWLKRAAAALLFLLVALCFAPTLVPPFLDRIYYRGPEGGHFDGERFFNPGRDLAEEDWHDRARGRFFAGWWMGSAADWPDNVPVRPSVPPRRVTGDAMRVTWIGHSTVLVQANGLNILTDPIWSERASPFSFIGPKRVRAPGVAFDDLPTIDLVLISHNHYDHLDLPTLRRLSERDSPLIVTSLGNGTILKGEGLGARELDWGQSLAAGPVRVTVERNQHWSSRWGVDRNRALWSAFTVHFPGGNLFYAGDTGFGDGSWIEEAASRGPVRLAILPIGAFEPRGFMKLNHVNPEESVRIFDRLRPALALGVHWGTFQLTYEPIEEPVRRLELLKRGAGIPAGRFVAPEAGAAFDVPPL